MRAFLSRLKSRLSPPALRWEVRFDDEGFSVLEDGERKQFVHWSEPVEVFAYKTDLFAYDETCLGFRLDAVGNYRCVSEECIGYEKFLSELSRRFPGIRTDWLPEVVFPAFVENRTTLWGESWIASGEKSDLPRGESRQSFDALVNRLEDSLLPIARQAEDEIRGSGLFSQVQMVSIRHADVVHAMGVNCRPVWATENSDRLGIIAGLWGLHDLSGNINIQWSQISSQTRERVILSMKRVGIAAYS